MFSQSCPSMKELTRQTEGGIMPTRANLSAGENYQHHHTELMGAALEGQTETVQALLDHRQDVNAKDDEGRTALMFAAVNQHTETAKTLLEHGRCRSAEIVRALLVKGADVRGEFGETGKTALSLAEEHGHTAVKQLLKSWTNLTPF
jgi:ankyrin repeat protein